MGATLFSISKQKLDGGKFTFNYNIVFNSHSLFLQIKSGAMLFNLIYPMVSSWKQLSLLVYILMNLSLM